MIRTLLKVVVAAIILWIIIVIPKSLADAGQARNSSLRDSATGHIEDIISETSDNSLGEIQKIQECEKDGPIVAGTDASSQEEVMYERAIAEYVKTFYIA